MTAERGREGRLKQEHAALYPGLQPDVWLPVETLLQYVTELIYRDRSKSDVITGTRLLHQDHFEYRGSSARPEGLPAGATRMSDSEAEPGEPRRRAEAAGSSRPRKKTTPEDDTQ
jgi:hypothetical protein